MRPEFNKAFDSFLVGCQKIVNEHHIKKGWDPVRELKYKYLAVRVRVWDEKNGVFCFVDLGTGDVFKAASWLAPAKHARGNIFDEHNGLSQIEWHGPRYLR